MDTKTKTVAKKTVAPKAPSQDVKMRDFLIKNPLDRVTRTVLKRHYKLKPGTSFHPQKAEDIENILILLEGCEWIDITCMTGYCKLWDVVIDDWDTVSYTHLTLPTIYSV